MADLIIACLSQKGGVGKSTLARLIARPGVATPKFRSFLPTEGVSVASANNMNMERLAPMTFNMPRDWHTEFKMAAVQRGINMKDLLIECFDAWKVKNHGK